MTAPDTFYRHRRGRVALVTLGSGLVLTTLVACGGTSGVSVATTADATATVATPAAPALAGDFAGVVDIGGRGLYLECTGSGSPTVILESGQWMNGQVWTEDLTTWLRRTMVQPGVAEFTRVCSYDRPARQTVAAIRFHCHARPAAWSRTSMP